MSEYVTDELVEAGAKLLDPDAWEMSAGDYQDAHGRSYGGADDFIRSAQRTARSRARKILRAVAPLIAAKALRDAADAAMKPAKGHRDFATKRGRDACICAICDMCRALETALRGAS